MNEAEFIGGLNRYQHAMADAGAAALLLLKAEDRAHGSQRLSQLLYGTNVSEPGPQKAHRRDQDTLSRLLFGMVQITDATDMLQDAETYLKRLSHKGLIAPERFLR